jgi:hypothetical protein
VKKEDKMHSGRGGAYSRCASLLAIWHKNSFSSSHCANEALSLAVTLLLSTKMGSIAYHFHRTSVYTLSQGRMARAWSDFEQSNLLTWLFVGGLSFLLVALAALYASIEIHCRNAVKRALA